MKQDYIALLKSPPRTFQDWIAALEGLHRQNPHDLRTAFAMKAGWLKPLQRKGLELFVQDLSPSSEKFITRLAEAAQKSREVTHIYLETRGEVETVEALNRLTQLTFSPDAVPLADTRQGRAVCAHSRVEIFSTLTQMIKDYADTNSVETYLNLRHRLTAQPPKRFEEMLACMEKMSKIAKRNPPDFKIDPAGPALREDCTATLDGFYPTIAKQFVHELTQNDRSSAQLLIAYINKMAETGQALLPSFKGAGGRILLHGANIVDRFFRMNALFSPNVTRGLDSLLADTSFNHREQRDTIPHYQTPSPR